jgi:hypothetical protein
MAMIVMAAVVILAPWPGQVAAQVDIDLGGVRIQIGDRPPPPPVVEVVVLTRGPIHEAFAQPVIFDEGAGFMITRRPPPAIYEMPPDQRPVGNHFIWIPGYWGWDSDRDDFIWVSGCWRAVPPNNSWVPGYWAVAGGGYQWVAGFWTSDGIEEIEYLPAPPAVLETGPQGPGFPDSVWIPGCWVRYQGRYAWRPGFWVQARQDWIWVPAQYVATPRGWIYVDGYWDYPLERRGVAFLPVHCPPSLYVRSDFRYSPLIALDLGVLTVNLFSSPQRRHYYFGDYYGPEYSRGGFYPWYEVRERRGWYDPIYVHERWRHRDDRMWDDNQRTQYERRRDNHSLRPARTYEALREQTARMPERDRRQTQVGRPMREVVSDNTTPLKFDTLDTRTREAADSRARDSRDYQEKRAQWESTSRGGPESREPSRTSPREPAPTPPREPTRAPAGEPVPPKDLPRPPREPAPPRELPKPPVREESPPEKSRTPDRSDVVREPPVAQDAPPQRVKVPKPPIAVREPAAKETLTPPPPRPKQPGPDLDARPKGKDAPGRSRDDDRPDRDREEDRDKDKDKGRDRDKDDDKDGSRRR